MECKAERRTATARVEFGAGSRLATQRAELAAAREKLQQVRNESLNARNAYRAALAEHARAAAALDTDPKAREQIRAAAAKLQKAAAALAKLDDVFSARFLSEARRDSLAEFLSAVAETPPGQAPPQTASKAAAALVLLPEAFDETRGSLAEARRPSLVPLLLRKNHEQLNLEAATRRIASQEMRVDLHEARLAKLTEQAAQLKGARDAMSRILPRLQPTTIIDVAGGSGSREDKRSLFEALALYLDAGGRLTAEERKLEYRQFALAHEEALALAEVNVLQWDSLIDTTVGQVAAFGKSGIRAEHILALINSLTLLWIGIGVN
jgi:hypothetical protein